MNTSGSHLSKDMLDLIKSIGDSRSKQEEDKIISKECDILKSKIRESGVNNKKMKEYLLRAIYIEMLGHDAHFAQKYTLNLTQDKNILNKRVGYLACNILLSESSEFLILLVASLQKDIQSSNWVEVCMALTSVIKFANSIIMPAVTEPILKLLDNKSEQIRKKSVMCLYRFFQVNPTFIPDCDDRMRRLLCDFDPSVMAASLNYFAEVVRKTPEKYKDLVSPLIVILKQVIEHKLPREFDYHRFPAPWLQVKLLEILSYIGRDDQAASENMYEILSQTLRRADDTGINIGYAIVYQCLRTICIIYPNQHLIELASTTISRFLSSDSPNLRCTGINGLGLIIQINPSYVMNHQQVIVDCLEENDETLKRNTFDLLYKMTTMDNVELIVDKMMKYLKYSTLEQHGRKDTLHKITELAERFAPDRGWFIKIMNQLFVNFGDLITDEILSKLIKLINEWEGETDEQEFKEFTIDNYQAIIDNYSSLPDSLVKLMAWVIGEYGKKLYAANDNDSNEKVIGLLQMLEYLLSKSYDDDMTKCMLITAITKVHSKIGFTELPFITNIIDIYARDRNTEIQQRCLEYKRLMSSNTIMHNSQFTTILDELDIDNKLSFLDSFVSKKISEGAREYNREKYEAESGMFGRGEKGELNFGPYCSPDVITSNPNKMADTLTKLYNTKDTTLRSNPVSNDLKVGEAKWSAEGYKEVKKPQAPSVVPQQGGITSVESNPVEKKKGGLFGLGGIGSSSSANNTSSSNQTTIVHNSNPRFESIKGPTVDKGKGEKRDEVKSIFSGIKKKDEPVYDKNRDEKEKMKGIFGGLSKGGSSSISASDSASSNMMGSQSQRNNTRGNNMGSTNKSNVGDLIGMGASNNSNNNNNKQNTQPKQQVQTQQNTFNLLDEIFSGGSSSNTTTQNTNTSGLFADLTAKSTNTNTNKQPANLYDMGANPTNSNNNNNSKSMFDMLNNNKQTSGPKSLKDSLAPFNTDTDTFGELWTSCPYDETSFDFSTRSIRTPEAFLKIISSEANFKPVQIIGTEAIAAAKYKNKITLVHTSINGDNTLSMLVKCYDNSLTNEIGNFLQGLLSAK